MADREEGVGTKGTFYFREKAECPLCAPFVLSDEYFDLEPEI